MRSLAIKVKLAELLKERGWSLYRLSKETGVANPNIWRLARNKTVQVTFPVLASICEALDCQVGDFIVYEREQMDLPIVPADKA